MAPFRRDPQDVQDGGRLHRHDRRRGREQTEDQGIARAGTRRGDGLDLVPGRRDVDERDVVARRQGAGHGVDLVPRTRMCSSCAPVRPSVRGRAIGEITTRKVPSAAHRLPAPPHDSRAQVQDGGGLLGGDAGVVLQDRDQPLILQR